jgi:methionine sulfoxide reductase heme-binding subunit
VSLPLTPRVTTLRRLSGRHWLLRLRRMLDLYAFFYACLRFTTYMCLDPFLDRSEIIRDISKRPFITVGFITFVLLHPAGGNLE